MMGRFLGQALSLEDDVVGHRNAPIPLRPAFVASFVAKVQGRGLIPPRPPALVVRLPARSRLGCYSSPVGGSHSVSQSLGAGAAALSPPRRASMSGRE
jgi:hypothetical protein